MPIPFKNSLVALMLAVTAACAPADAHVATHDASPDAASDITIVTVADTTVVTQLAAAGVALPIREATLSTKLMASVVSVAVLEGAQVRAGTPLLRLDARDLAAKREQVIAGRAAAQAMHAQAAAQAARVRALYADDAAPRAMLDAAEAGLAQAESGLRANEAAAAELDAVTSYATLSAPFDGVVTKRFVDPGAFAAPGTPLLTVQDASSLRLSVHVAPSAVRALVPGSTLPVVIEGVPDQAVIEGVVPAAGGLYAVNVVVRNPQRRHLAGSAATVLIPTGSHRGIAVPEAALIREGNLVGVLLRTAQGDVRRWIRTGAAQDDLIEVTAGLRAGDQVIVRSPAGVE